MKLVLDASVALSGLYTRAAAQEAMVAQHLLASIDNNISNAHGELA